MAITAGSCGSQALTWARAAALPLAVQDQQAADVAQLAIQEELHQRLARLAQRLLVQIQAALQLVFAESQLLVDALLHPVALEADEVVGIEHGGSLHAEASQSEPLGAGGLAARELCLGRGGVARWGPEVVAAQWPHVGHFLQEQ